MLYRRAKLDESGLLTTQVLEARELYAAGRSVEDLAEFYDVPLEVMRSAVTRRRWEHQ